MSEWTTWNGGNCPVDGEALVDVKFNNSRDVNKIAAKRLNWYPFSLNLIIAYRISKGE